MLETALDLRPGRPQRSGHRFLDQVAQHQVNAVIIGPVAVPGDGVKVRCQCRLVVAEGQLRVAEPITALANPVRGRCFCQVLATECDHLLMSLRQPVDPRQPERGVVDLGFLFCRIDGPGERRHGLVQLAVCRVKIAQRAVRIRCQSMTGKPGQELFQCLFCGLRFPGAGLRQGQAIERIRVQLAIFVLGKKRFVLRLRCRVTAQEQVTGGMPVVGWFHKRRLGKRIEDPAELLPGLVVLLELKQPVAGPVQQLIVM